MYTSLIIYRNELKNKNVPKYKMIGIVTELIYSKTIFNQNKEIFDFVKNTFDYELKDYILKSRTMIVAKVSRIIINSENTTAYKKELYKFINFQIEEFKKKEDIKDKKNELDGWI